MLRMHDGDGGVQLEQRVDHRSTKVFTGWGGVAGSFIGFDLVQQIPKRTAQKTTGGNYSFRSVPDPRVAAGAVKAQAVRFNVAGCLKK